MANIRMLRDRILVLPIERKLSSIIEVKNTEKFNLGTVIACGPGKEINGRVHPMDVKVGDTIRWGEFDFPSYEENGVKYQIIVEADVAAVVEPEPFSCAFDMAPKWTEQEQKMLEEHAAKFGRGKLEFNRVEVAGIKPAIVPAYEWTEAEEEEFRAILPIKEISLDEAKAMFPQREQVA